MFRMVIVYKLYKHFLIVKSFAQMESGNGYEITSGFRVYTDKHM